jgi:hypothetical protein
MSADVLKKTPPRLNLADDSLDAWPEVSWVVFSASSSRTTEWLARVASSEDIHCSTPRVAVE